MSTKTFSNNDSGPVIVSLILSFLAHIILAVMVITLRPVTEAAFERLAPSPAEPVIVDVIELPPGAPSSASVSNAAQAYYEDRPHSAQHETRPERGAMEAVGAVPPPVPATSASASSSSSVGALSTAKSSAPRPGEVGVIGAAPSKEAITTHAASGNAGVTGAPASGVVDGRPGAVAQTGKGAPSKPNLFLSEERLTELAERYEAEAPKGEKGKTLNLNTSEIRYQRYLINMKNRIEYVWDYPPVASRNGWQGKLNIDFTIKRDGTVTDIKLVKSSNYPVLDDAAITALRLAAPFPAFPDDFAVEEITVKGQFIYDIYQGAAH